MVTSYSSGISNPNSKEFLEEDVRKVFENGEAAFALNWTYMYNLANTGKDSKVAGKVGVVPAPGVSGKSEVSAVNGSMGLGITATSKHPGRGLELYYLHDLAGRAETSMPSSACRSGRRPTRMQPSARVRKS